MAPCAQPWISVKTFSRTWSEFIQMDSPMSSSNLDVFSLLFLIGRKTTNSMTIFCLILLRIRFLSHHLAGVPWWTVTVTFKIPLYKSSVNYFSLPKPTPFDTQYLILYKEVTSSVCTSVAILTTLIRLFVRRSVFWFDDVSRFSWPKTNSSREPACRLTDEYRQARCWACYS